MTKLTPEKVREHRLVIEMGMDEENKRHKKEMEKWLKLDKENVESCPHKNMNSAPYTKWCTDCGKDWDTT